MSRCTSAEPVAVLVFCDFAVIYRHPGSAERIGGCSNACSPAFRAERVTFTPRPSPPANIAAAHAANSSSAAIAAKPSAFGWPAPSELPSNDASIPSKASEKGSPARMTPTTPPWPHRDVGCAASTASAGTTTTDAFARPCRRRGRPPNSRQSGGHGLPEISRRSGYRGEGRRRPALRGVPLAIAGCGPGQRPSLSDGAHCLSVARERGGWEQALQWAIRASWL